MFKNLFSRKNNVVKIDINLLSKVLKGYNFDVREKNIIIKKKYVIKGQEMNRVYIEGTENGYMIIDGWNAPILKTTKERLSADLDRLYNGDFSGGEARRVFYKNGVSAIY